jgi:hypothetical protein
VVGLVPQPLGRPGYTQQQAAPSSMPHNATTAAPHSATAAAPGLGLGRRAKQPWLLYGQITLPLAVGLGLLSWSTQRRRPGSPGWQGPPVTLPLHAAARVKMPSP